MPKFPIFSFKIPTTQNEIMEKDIIIAFTNGEKLYFFYYDSQNKTWKGVNSSDIIPSVSIESGFISLRFSSLDLTVKIDKACYISSPITNNSD